MPGAEGEVRREEESSSLGVTFIACAVVILLAWPGEAGWWWGEDPPPASETRIHLLHVNDVHSHVEAEDLKLDLEGLGIPRGSLESLPEGRDLYIKYGGYPLMTQALADREAFWKTNENEPVFKFHAGDALTGTLWYALLNSEADAALTRQACFDTFTPGNHEFDDGDGNLQIFLARLENASNGGCAPAVISANIRPGPSSPLIGKIQNHTVIDRGGVKLGIIGVTTKLKTEESSRPDRGTTLEDEKTAAQREIDALSAKGIKHIVLISHIGYKNDLVLARELNGVDVIIGGDSHSLLSSDQPTTDFLGVPKDADYPVKEGNVCVVQAWEWAHVIGDLTVAFDDDGVVTSCTGQPFVPLERESLNQRNDTTVGEPLSPADGEKVHKEISALQGTMFIDTTKELYKDVKATVEYFAPIVRARVNEPVGSVSRELVQRRMPGGNDATYKHGCEVAPVLGRTFTLRMKSACLAIVNSGGVRGSIGAGQLTYGGLVQVLPFSNSLVEINITGAKIKATLTAALNSTAASADNSGSFPYAWGLRYDVDMSNKEQRLSNVQVNCRLLHESWHDLEDDKVYLIVVQHFISTGAGGFGPLGEISDDNKMNSGIIDVEAVRQYLKDKDLEPESDDDRPIRHFVDNAQCNHSSDATCGGSIPGAEGSAQNRGVQGQMIV